MRFRLAQRSMTLDDLEVLYKLEFSCNFAWIRGVKKQRQRCEWR